ncbi:BlaI/MecI/CopY family transcriptional regulator [Saccharicrinis sp. FJH2]|uniref:BlaI/MecI/CopY family transcriptional regulator n=1 Tax=unclassified Saccharicrinis TaxID=2646859 RepID=UPI0035D47AE1
MKELTKAEEQVMQVIWEKGKLTVNDVLEDLPEPKPAYNTVSTIVRILEKKRFVDHEPFGRGYLYFPLITKPEYTKKFMKNFIGNYFGNSFKDMVSFFAKTDKMDLETFEKMMEEIKKELK